MLEVEPTITHWSAWPHYLPEVNKTAKKAVAGVAHNHIFNSVR